MRVVLDARWIFREISGIGTYATELIRHLPRMHAADEYLLLFCDRFLRDRTLEETGVGALPNVRTIAAPYGVFSPAGQLLLPRALHRLGADVFHSPNYMIPLLAFPRRRAGRVRCVVTIHDVIPLKFPDHAPRSRKSRLFWLYRRIMAQVGARADAIIAVSRSSREDAIRHLGIPLPDRTKVRVVYNGVSELFRPPAARPPRTGGVRTLLYVGRADPYKNLDTLIRAFAAARARSPHPLCLRLVGPPDPRYPEAGRLSAELGLGDAVQWTGYLSPDRLVAAYQEADALVHPSRYEGFGLQVAEAMACGTPVICSDRGSLPEVAGDAALLFDPDDADALAAHILSVTGDERLAADLSLRGLRQAAKFTWARAAAETHRVYEEATA